MYRLSTKEFERVLAADEYERYEYFLDKVREYGELYVLEKKDGSGILIFEINGRAMGVTNKVFLQKVIKLICLYFKLLIFMKSLKFDLLVTLSSGHHVIR